MKIEAIFGGALALFIMVLALFALAPGIFGAQGRGPQAPGGLSAGSVSLCQCFDEAAGLAQSPQASVLSAEYRTGFERCRAQLDQDGGDYWTAGWNSVRSSKPWASSCHAYQRRG